MSGRGKSSGIGITSGSESDIPIKSPKRKKITDTLYHRRRNNWLIQLPIL